MLNIFDEILKLAKISKFNAEIRTKDGTFLCLDGEFGVGVTVKVQTAEGLNDIPDGPYILGTPYDGVIIEIVKGKIKQIVHPLQNSPTPNPLETPPMLADGAIGIVGGEIMSKQVKTNMEDNTATTASTGPDAGAQTSDPKTPDTVQSDKANVYTIEQL